MMSISSIDGTYTHKTNGMYMKASYLKSTGSTDSQRT